MAKALFLQSLSHCFQSSKKNRGSCRTDSTTVLRRGIESCDVKKSVSCSCSSDAGMESVDELFESSVDGDAFANVDEYSNVADECSNVLDDASAKTSVEGYVVCDVPIIGENEK
jgi:hypothetical protein